MPIEKLRPSFTFTEDRLKELQAVVPEAFADGKINWDVLREALGEYLEDPTQEHFGLTWPGKREARRLAAMPSKGTLVLQPGEGVNENNTRNIFIEGDNLEVLKLLLKSYAGRVKMIYIDPPYNTGKDFIYEDDFSEPLETYLKRTGQMDEAGRQMTTNSRASGRFHSKWLSMMYPRLLLARQLLREDGVILVSIDDNEVNNLRQILDEALGEENFVAAIVWKKKTGSGSQIQRIFSEHEYVLVYIKDSNAEDRWRINNEDDGNFTNPDNDPRGPWESCAITAPSKNRNPNQFYQIEVYFDQPNKVVSDKENLLNSFNYNGHTIVFRSVTGDAEYEAFYSEEMRYAKFIRRWAYVTKSMKKVFDDGKVYLNRGNLPRYKKFKSDYEGKALRSIYFSEFSTQQGTTELEGLFGKSLVEYPKPLRLLKTFLIPITEESDIVLDFFAGSCTTAHAVLQQNREDGGNRQFIMVQLPEPTPPDSAARQAGYTTIAEIGKERIRRVIRKLQEEKNGQLTLPEGEQAAAPEDLGFRVFKLDRSHFIEWQSDVQDVSQLGLRFVQAESPLVEGWKPEHLLTEILLLQGFPLDSQVIPLDSIQSNHVQRVHSDACEHDLFVCLDAAIHPDTIPHLHLRDQDVFICLDAALTDQLKVQLADTCNLKVI